MMRTFSLIWYTTAHSLFLNMLYYESTIYIFNSIFWLKTKAVYTDFSFTDKQKVVVLKFRIVSNIFLNIST